MILSALNVRLDIDGELQERNGGELDHSDVQKRITALLDVAENHPFLRVNQALRVQINPDRFRVPDVCVMRRSAPREQIVHAPPLLCIEVLSPSDTMVRMRERIADYFAIGVPEVWILNSVTRSAIVCRSEGEIKQIGGSLTVPETPIMLSLNEVFKVLDEYD